MPPAIEQYALLGDTQTGALVSKAGSIDWLCLPRFDSAGPFAALLGDEGNGRWQIAPIGQVRATGRRYRGNTLVLETDFETAEGSIRLVDFMPPRLESLHVVRLVVGVRGQVRVHMDLRPRFDYGRIRPWLRQIDGADVAVGGLDSVWLRTPVETRAEDTAVRSDFLVSAGELLPFVLTWHPSHEPAPRPVDPLRALADTEAFWTGSSGGQHFGNFRKAFSHVPHIMAAHLFDEAAERGLDTFAGPTADAAPGGHRCPRKQQRDDPVDSARASAPIAPPG